MPSRLLCHRICCYKSIPKLLLAHKDVSSLQCHSTRPSNISTLALPTPRCTFSTAASRRNADVVSTNDLTSTPSVEPSSSQPGEKSVDGEVSSEPRPRASTTTASNSTALTTDEPDDIRNSESWPRRPRALQAIYLRPLKRRAQYRVPACDLQLRSYNARSLEFFADFALRAAYYLGLPASGPVPLPRITERWTVPRSNFIFKKSQENFERITMRRLIQIQDGNVDVVETWLAFLRKHAYHGVGMKANVWQFEKLHVGKTLDAKLENLKKNLEPSWAQFGRRKNAQTAQKAAEILGKESLTDSAPIN